MESMENTNLQKKEIIFTEAYTSKQPWTYYVNEKGDRPTEEGKRENYK